MSIHTWIYGGLHRKSTKPIALERLSHKMIDINTQIDKWLIVRSFNANYITIINETLHQ